MAFSASLAHSSFLKLSTSLHGEISSSSSSCLGTSLTFYRSSFSGNQSSSEKKLMVFAKRLSGLQEAMRIKRERELGVTKLRRRPPLKRGKVSPRLPVPDHIPRPPYVGSDILPEISSEHQIHDSEGIACMRAAGELAARVLNYAGTLVKFEHLDAVHG